MDPMLKGVILPPLDSVETLAEKMYSPLPHWLGFEPDAFPTLVPAEPTDVIGTLRVDKDRVEALAAEQHQHEQQALSEAVRHVQMARLSGIKNVKMELNLAKPAATADQPPEGLLPPSTAASVATDLTDMSHVTDDSVRLDGEAVDTTDADGGGSQEKDGEEVDDEPAPDLPAIPWTFWLLDLAPKKPIVGELPQRALVMAAAALKTMKDELAVERRYQEEQLRAETPSTEYDPIARILEEGGIDMLLNDARGQLGGEEAERAKSSMRQRQQQRNLRKVSSDLGRPSDTADIDTPAPKSLGISRSRLSRRAHVALADSKPRAVAEAQMTRMQGAVFVGEPAPARVRAHRRAIDRIVARIQGLARGYLDRGPNGAIARRRTAHELQRSKSAQSIQKHLRGFIARARVEYMIANMPSMDSDVAATIIQCMYRRRRAMETVDIERTYLQTLAEVGGSYSDGITRSPSPPGSPAFPASPPQDPVDIDEVLRRHDHKQAHEDQTRAAMSIQRVRRGAAARRRYMLTTDDEVGDIVQAEHRPRKQLLYVEDEFEQGYAATAIQARYRGFVARTRDMVEQARTFADDTSDNHASNAEMESGVSPNSETIDVDVDVDVDAFHAGDNIDGAVRSRASRTQLSET